MLTPGQITFCTVTYDGRKLPADHPNHSLLRLKGEVYESGQSREIPATSAGLLLRSAPEGTVTVTKGEPIHQPILPLSAKEAARKAREHRSRFPTDPAKALDEFAPLPEATRKALAGKAEDVVKYLDTLTDRGLLLMVAIYCRLGGRQAIAEAAVRRGAALAQAEQDAALGQVG